MPALQIKDCPQDVYDRLKQCAAEEDRSMTQQALHIIRKFLDMRAVQNGYEGFTGTVTDELRERARVEKRRQLLESIGNNKPITEVPEGYESVAEMIRADRESRIPVIDGME